MDNDIKIKICGMTNSEDAQLAASRGVDFLGLISAKSPRQVGFSRAQKIIKKISTSVNWVGVFKNQPIEKVYECAYRLNLKWIQLHGDEDINYVHALLGEFHVVKTFEVQESTRQSDIENYPGDWVLLDVPKSSNRTVDWGVAEQIARKKKVFLGGGLKRENITEAIDKVKPCAVDVCRGVEAFPGRKDPYKLEALVRIIKQGAGG